MEIRLKRVYEKPDAQDGLRVLVDRLWPRGVRKEEAGVDLWLKEIAPSPALRRWFGHDPQRWDEFRRRYAEELKGKPRLVEDLRRRAESGSVTLVFAARDEERNNASALRKFLLRRDE